MRTLTDLWPPPVLLPRGREALVLRPGRRKGEPPGRALGALQHDCVLKALWRERQALHCGEWINAQVEWNDSASFWYSVAPSPSLPYNHQSSCAVGGILEKSKTAFLSLSPVTVTYFLLKIIISGKRKHWPSFIYIHKSIMSSWIRFRRQLVRKKRMAMTTMTWQVAQTSRKPSR